MLHWTTVTKTTFVPLASRIRTTKIPKGKGGINRERETVGSLTGKAVSTVYWLVYRIIYKCWARYDDETRID